jgi:hypothetical protein
MLDLWLQIAALIALTTGQRVNCLLPSIDTFSGYHGALCQIA